jgi:hypothetical protein
MADLHKAIRAIHNNVVSINGDTQADIQAVDNNNQLVTIDWTQVNAWTDSNQYKYDRQQAYAPLAEQLDYIYHNGIEAWKTDMIMPVKEAHPKGDE